MSKYKPGNDIHEHKKTGKRMNHTLNLSQMLDLRSSNKYVASKLVNLLHVENIGKQHKNNKLKIKAPTWNDEFELPDVSYSVSNIQD